MPVPSEVEGNGRLYDPQLRRFLAPDNHIQDPYDSRSYDRFSYVWYNPLMASDPSGEFIATALAIIKIVGYITTAVRAVQAIANGASLGQVLFGIAVGIVLGEIAGSIGGSASGLLSSSATAFAKGFVGGFIGGFVSGTLGAVINGANIGDALKAGLITGAVAGVLAGLQAAANTPGAAVQTDGGTDKGMSDTVSTGDGSRLPGGSSGGGGPGVDIGQVTTPGVMTVAEAGSGEYSPDWWNSFQNQIPEVFSDQSFPSPPPILYSGAATPMGFDSPFFVPSLAFGALSLGAKVVRGVSVIGPRATYRQFGNKIGANYLNVTDEAWTMQKNMDFLRGVVKRGDNVIFAGKFNPAKLNSSSVLAKEINYLQRHGYKWTENYSKLIKQ